MQQHRDTDGVISRIRDIMNRTPLWLTFTVFMSFCLMILTLILSFSNYRRSVTTAIARENKATSQMIDLKLQNLEQYLQELSDYCIQPVYDLNFYHDLLSAEALSDSRIDELREEAAQYYYSRTDLISYRMDLLRQDVTFERKAGDQQMKTRTGATQEMEAIVAECQGSPYNDAISPSTASDGLLRFSHTIIRVSDSLPAAVVSIDVDQSMMRTGFQGQTVLLVSGDNELLYTNASDDLADAIEIAMHSRRIAPREDTGTTMNLAGTSYLYVSGKSDAGITLGVLTPMSQITGQFQRLRFISFLQGAIFLCLSIAATIVLIRYLTAPLGQLVAQQNRLAEGDFGRIHIGRCLETTELGRSFNDMSEHIDRLVNDNLVASINEKNARIEALEAQVSPHFLYNTLQAIGAEALLNDEPQLYTMLTRLANNMRYSINGSNEVALRDELEFVDNYIELQKLRMEERLEVTRRVDQSLLGNLVPKCGLQQIVENSIKYGLRGEVSRIHLEIDIFRQGDMLCIRVRDNGAGMTPERLQEVRERVEAREPAKAAGIGLVNLRSRLFMMYGEDSVMQIDSSNDADGHYTCVTLQLWTMRERRTEEQDAQGTDC